MAKLVSINMINNRNHQKDISLLKFSYLHTSFQTLLTQIAYYLNLLENTLSLKYLIQRGVEVCFTVNGRRNESENATNSQNILMLK